MLSLYGQYILEREGKNIVETEYGFATYKLYDHICYVEDVFVVPEMRGHKHAARLVDEVCEIVQKQGATVLVTSVCTDANDNTNSMKAILNYGFRLKNCSGNMIYFEKNIGEL